MTGITIVSVNSVNVSTNVGVPGILQSMAVAVLQIVMHISAIHQPPNRGKVSSSNLTKFVSVIEIA